MRCWQLVGFGVARAPRCLSRICAEGRHAIRDVCTSLLEASRKTRKCVVVWAHKEQKICAVRVDRGRGSWKVGDYLACVGAVGSRYHFPLRGAAYVEALTCVKRRN